jgi:hypothetical protein
MTGLAEQETVGHINLNFRSWPIYAIRINFHEPQTLI